MGLGVPRKTMRLSGKPQTPQLLVRGTDENLTSLALETSKRMMAPDLDLDSFIFKKDSPSCGLERVKIYGKNDSPSRSAVGIFASAVKTKYPTIPLIEEGRLTDLKQRELYVVRLFAFTELKRIPLKVAALQKFHQDYKLLLMAHAPDQYRMLGNLAANSSRKSVRDLLLNYQTDFLKSINRAPTRKQWFNVLQHMMGYFKKTIPSGERQQLMSSMEEYRRGVIPLVAVLTLFKYLAQRHSVAYLLTQKLFQPYPKNLLLVQY